MKRHLFNLLVALSLALMIGAIGVWMLAWQIGSADWSIQTAHRNVSVMIVGSRFADLGDDNPFRDEITAHFEPGHIVAGRFVPFPFAGFENEYELARVVPGFWLKITPKGNATHFVALSIRFWLLAIATSLFPSCRLIHFFKVRAQAERNRAPYLCPTCGYDLRATPDRCPECGKVPAGAAAAEAASGA